MRKRISQTIVVSALVIGCLASCTSPAPDQPDAPVQPTEPSSVVESATEGDWRLQTFEQVILITPKQQPKMSLGAQASGTLMLTDAGCLGMGDGVEAGLVAFPWGAVMLDDGRVEIDGEIFAVGDAVVLGGGSVPSDSTLQELCGSTETVYLASRVIPLRP